MASQFLEPPIPCDVRGTSQLAVASVDQRMACEDLDRFAHVRDRRQNRIAVRDEFQYPLEIRDYARAQLDRRHPLARARLVYPASWFRDRQRPPLHHTLFRCAGLRPRRRGCLEGIGGATPRVLLLPYNCSPMNTCAAASLGDRSDAFLQVKRDLEVREGHRPISLRWGNQIAITRGPSFNRIGNGASPVISSRSRGTAALAYRHPRVRS